jgi:large subunit ribosomal protein L29
MAKLNELKTQTSDQLGDRLIELKKEQFNLRFQRASGQLENTARVRQVRREIATIRTLMGERTRATAPSKGV